MKFNYNRIFKIIIFLSAVTGIVAHIITFGEPLQKFTYFTLQSNFLVAIIYFILILKQERSRFFTLIENKIVIAIVLTGLVFNIVLRPAIDINEYNQNNFSDFFLHSFTPILVIIDRIIFTEKGSVKKYDPIIWLAYPLIYWVFTIIFVYFGGNFNTTNIESNYPYFFLNFKEVGVGYFFLVISFIILIGYLVYFEDMFRNNKKCK